MEKTAFLFPGQGAQHAGMGADLYDASPEARARFDAADALLGFPLTERMFGTEEEADEDTLTPTEVAQPALYVHSLAAVAALEEQGHTPDMAAGHSLGEYSALAAAGAIGFEDGLRVVRRRGELMAAAGAERPGTMAAVLRMDDDAVRALCRDASSPEGDGLVQAANFNAPGQVVISGDTAAVERATAMAKERGGRALPLQVSGAFHSPLMEEARAGLADALGHLSIEKPRCPVYLNTTARPTTDPEAIREGLLEQLLSPVLWAPTLQAMQADGATRFVEVGAGKVLSGLVRRTLGREAETAQAGTAEEVEALSAAA